MSDYHFMLGIICLTGPTQVIAQKHTSERLNKLIEQGTMQAA